MFRVIVVFLILPFWAYFLLAAGVGYLTESTYTSQLEKQSERVQALSQDPPALVDLSDFRIETDISPVNEVHIEGWVNLDYNYNLTKTTNGAKTGERWMYLMFGRADATDTKVVRAALVFTASEKAKFLENGSSYISGIDATTDQIILKFNGFGLRSDSFSGLVKDAIKEKNLTPAPNFIYISPFLNGREAALSPQGKPEKTRLNGWLFAAAVALFGLVKFGFGRRKKTKLADAPMAAQSRVPQAAGPSADAIVAPQMAQFATAPAQKNVQKTEKKFPVKLALLTVIVVAIALRPEAAGILLPILMIFGFWVLSFSSLRKVKQVASDFAEKATVLAVPKQTFSNVDLAPSLAQPSPEPAAMAPTPQSASFDRWATSTPTAKLASGFAPKSRPRDSFSDGPVKSGSTGLFGRFAKKNSVDPFEKLAQARKSF